MFFSRKQDRRRRMYASKSTERDTVALSWRRGLSWLSVCGKGIICLFFQSLNLSIVEFVVMHYLYN